MSILTDRKSTRFALDEFRHPPTTKESAISIKYLNSGRFVYDVEPVLIVDRDCSWLHESAVIQSATSPNEDVLGVSDMLFKAATNCRKAKQADQGGIQMDCPEI